jgi:hypothetical protein
MSPALARTSHVGAAGGGVWVTGSVRDAGPYRLARTGHVGAAGGGVWVTGSGGRVSLGRGRVLPIERA